MYQYINQPKSNQQPNSLFNSNSSKSQQLEFSINFEF